MTLRHSWFCTRLAPGLLALMALLFFPIPAPQQRTPHAGVTPKPSLAPAAGKLMVDSGPAHRVAQLTDIPLPMVSGARRSDLFPDVELTDQHGNTHLFRTDLVRDSIVCLMFFYTECQGTCPGTTQAMKRLRQSVADEFPGEQLRFVSITLDPEHDTPQDLLEYAEAHGVHPEGDMPDWYFCTGTRDDIEAVRRSLGLYDLDPVLDADRTQHAALLTFGNDRFNRWSAQPAGLKSSDLEETFLRIAGTSERQRFSGQMARGGILVRLPQSPGPATCCNRVLTSGNTSCCSKPPECCGQRNATP